MNEQSDQLSLAKERTALAAERSRLAFQRTFLSWVRTGLASVGGGVALARLISFENPDNQMISQRVGEALVLLGLLIFVLSLLDYRNNYKKTERRDYAGSIWSVTLISTVLVVISGLLFYVVFKIDL